MLNMIVLKLAIAKKSIGCSFGTMLNIKHDGSKTEHLLTLKIKCFWYHVKHDGSKTLSQEKLSELAFWYRVKLDGSKTIKLADFLMSDFWYRVKLDGSKTSQHVYIKIIVFQKVLKTLLYD